MTQNLNLKREINRGLTLVGVFGAVKEATNAVTDLKKLGFKGDTISLSLHNSAAGLEFGRKIRGEPGFKIIFLWCACGVILGAALGWLLAGGTMQSRKLCKEK